MLQICCIGHHLFDDGIKVSSTEEMIKIIRAKEQVACKECFEKFSKQALDVIKKIK